MKEKALGWAYPSSPSADELGFAKGCWIVTLGKPGKVATLLAGFAEKADALRYAENLPEQWSRWSDHK